MYVVRCKSGVTGTWTSHFYDTLEKALYYVKATKCSKSFADDTLFLTRENIELTAIYSSKNAPEIWRFKED